LNRVSLSIRPTYVQISRINPESIALDAHIHSVDIQVTRRFSADNKGYLTRTISDCCCLADHFDIPAFFLHAPFIVNNAEYQFSVLISYFGTNSNWSSGFLRRVNP